MKDYITLLGAEDVSRAGHNMSAAAGDMLRAVGQLEDSLQRNRRFMDEWLQTFEKILVEHKP